MSVVTVVYHYEDGSWWADSPDLEGMTVITASFDDLRAETRDAVEFYCETEPSSFVEQLASSAHTMLDPWAGISASPAGPAVVSARGFTLQRRPHQLGTHRTVGV